MGLLGEWLGFRGYWNHARGRVDKAEKLYRGAEKHYFRNARCRSAYGVLLLKKGEFEHAESIFRDLESEPLRGREFYYNKTYLATAVWKLGDLDTALDMLLWVYQRCKHSLIYGTLGYLLIEKGDLDQAYTYAREALEYDSADSVLLDNMGQIEYRRENYEAAQGYFEAALEARPKQIESRYYLALLLERRGERDKAAALLQPTLEWNFSALNTVRREDIEEKMRQLSA